MASMGGHVEFARVLIEAKADVNAANEVRGLPGRARDGIREGVCSGERMSGAGVRIVMGRRHAGLCEVWARKGGWEGRAWGERCSAGCERRVMGLTSKEGGWWRKQNGRGE
eukprot:3933310-Rhodomonas_salina.2